MLSRLARKWMFLGVVGALSGCATSGGENAREERSDLPDAVLEQMVKSTSAIEESIRLMAEVNAAHVINPKSDEELAQIRRNNEYVPAGLEKEVYIPRGGEAEVILATIADLTNYVFPDPIGRRPLNGAMVKLPKKARPAIDVIRDIGAQITDVAEINILPQVTISEAAHLTSRKSLGTLELVYRERGGR